MSKEKFSLIPEWNSFVKNDNNNLIEKCLKLAQILEYPELDISKELEKIKQNARSELKSIFVEKKTKLSLD